MVARVETTEEVEGGVAVVDREAVRVLVFVLE
jgi:hypothetical protein